MSNNITLNRFRISSHPHISKKVKVKGLAFRFDEDSKKSTKSKLSAKARTRQALQEVSYVSPVKKASVKKVSKPKRLTKEEKIDDAIEQYNKKIDRLSKRKNQLKIHAPSKLGKEFKEELSHLSTAQINKRLKDIQAFSEKGSEKLHPTKTSLKISEYEYDYLKKQMAKARRKLLKEKKRLEENNPSLLGHDIGTSFASMGDRRYVETLNKLNMLKGKKIENLTTKQYKSLLKNIEKVNVDERFKGERLKYTYELVLKQTAYYYGYPLSRVNEILEKLNKIDTTDFVELYRTEMSLKAIEENYHTLNKQMAKFDVNYYNQMQADYMEQMDALYHNIDDILTNQYKKKNKK